MSIGKIFFKWIDEDNCEPSKFNASIHCIEDLQIFSLSIQEREGEFSTAEISIENPIDPLFNNDSARYCFISCELNNSIELLFCGRLVGVPKDTTSEIIKITFLSEPKNREEIQSDFLNTLKVLPYYEPLVSAQKNADDVQEVLAARSSLLHWNRRTWALSLVDINGGSVNPVVFDETNIIDNSLKLDIGPAPAAGVQINVSGEWTQNIKRTLNFAPNIERAFSRNCVHTLTPESLESEWPKQGQTLGNNTGYTVSSSAIFKIRQSESIYAFYKPFAECYIDNELEPSGDPWIDMETGRSVYLPYSWYRINLWIDVNYQQKRREIASGLLEHKVQSVGPNSGKIESVDLQLGDLGAYRNSINIWQNNVLYNSNDEIVAQGFLWKASIRHISSSNFESDLRLGRWTQVLEGGSALGWPGQASYFNTFRGEQTLRHAMLRAKALLAKSSRCAIAKLQIIPELGLNLNTTNRVTINSSLLPSNTATGKITSWSFNINENGETTCELQVEFPIGLSGTNPNRNNNQGSIEDIVYDNFTREVFQPITLSSLTPSNLLLNIVKGRDGMQQEALLINSLTSDEIQQTLDASKTTLKLEMRSLAAYDQIETIFPLSWPNGWKSPSGIDLGDL